MGENYEKLNFRQVQARAAEILEAAEEGCLVLLGAEGEELPCLR